jgi:hypothetical protein
MQIHELNTFSGTQGAVTYLALDDGSQTTKIPITKAAEYVDLNTSAASGTTDGDLYRAITALGWQNDVIE